MVGRNASAADRIIKECGELNKEGKVEFLKADVTELKEVDLVCQEIQKREKKINLLFQTQGNLTLDGRNGRFLLRKMDYSTQVITDKFATENPEGLDRKFTLNYYSRMRFVYNLLPQLRAASAEPPHFSRTVSVLGAGHEGAINLSDLDLKTTFSGARCATHTIVMNDFMAEEFAAREHGISFLHTNPGVVNTGLSRGLPIWARALMKVATPLLSLFFVSADETGQRQLFLASSGIYPPAKPAEGAPLAAGVPFSEDFSVSKGSNGKIGSGAYLVNWKGDISGQEKILSDYREKGVGKTVWEHTMRIFKQVEKINQGGLDSAT